MMNKLQDKVALITGGSSGIGLAAAQLMKAEGATVIIVGRNEQKLQAAANTIGENVHIISADAATVAGIDLITEQVREKFGRLDILFANAGMSDSPELWDTDEAAYDLSMNTNVKSVFFLFTRAFPLLAEKASVIFTSSIAHFKGRPGDPLYAATKAAVRSLGRTFALQEEVLAKQIRVNVVSPGAVRTPLTQQDSVAMQTAIDDYITGAVPMKRWGLPEEVGKAVLFLASDDSAYITGTDLLVDGGWGQV